MKHVAEFHFDLGEKNIFEELFGLIERHRMDLYKNFPLGDFYDIVTAFDAAFQKFNSSNVSPQNIELYNQYLVYTVKNFLKIFTYSGFNDEPIFYSFKRFVSFFTMLLSEANELQNINDIRRNFIENFPSLEVDISNYDEEAYMHFLHGYRHDEDFLLIQHFVETFPVQIGVDGVNDEKRLNIYVNDFKARRIFWDNHTQKYVVEDEQFYMMLNIKIDSKENSFDEMLTPLWLITTALGKIENIRIELDEITKGSLFASFRVYMKDLVAKEETKAVLETAKEGILEKLTGAKHSEVKKVNKETEKVSLENEQLKTEIRQAPDDNQVKEQQRLELERKQLENDRLKIENAKGKIELIQNLSDLVKQGIIQADMVRIDINDILYLLKENGEVKEIGPDINSIT